MCAFRANVSTAGQHAIAALWDTSLAPLAQLDRALPSEGRGQRFESSRVRQPFSLFPKTRPSQKSAQTSSLATSVKLRFQYEGLPTIYLRQLGLPAELVLLMEYQNRKLFYRRTATLVVRQRRLRIFCKAKIAQLCGDGF